MRTTRSRPGIGLRMFVAVRFGEGGSLCPRLSIGHRGPQKGVEPSPTRRSPAISGPVPVDKALDRPMPGWPLDGPKHVEQVEL